MVLLVQNSGHLVLRLCKELGCMDHSGIAEFRSMLDATALEPKWPSPNGCCQGGHLTSCVPLQNVVVVNLTKQQRFVCTRVCAPACICVCAAAVSNGVMCGLRPLLAANMKRIF